MATSVDKFLLLTWKNWVLQYRRPMQTLFEFTGPVFFAFLLVTIRSLVDPKRHGDIEYDPFCTMPADFPLTELLCKEEVEYTTDDVIYDTSYYEDYILLYSPRNEVLQQVMNIFNDMFKNVEGVEDSRALETFFKKENSTRVFAAIQFEDDYKYLKNLKAIDNYKVSIRFPAETRSFLDPQFDNWKTNMIYPGFTESGPRQFVYDTGAAPSYFEEGFLAVQHLLTVSLIAARKEIASSNLTSWLGQNSLPLVSARRFPHAAWVTDPLLNHLQYLLGLMIMLSFVYSCINIVRCVTSEREKQLKEFMKIVGLSNWLQWSAWFLKYFVMLFGSAILLVVLLKVQWNPKSNFTVLTNSDPFVVLLFLVLYICASITFCFAISVMFNKANTAASVSGLIWFITYVPYMLLQREYPSINLIMKLSTCLISNSAMGLGFHLILQLEEKGKGIQWSTLFYTNDMNESMTVGLIMVILALDSFIYLMFAVYIEEAFPGEYGVPKPWYFFCKPDYWYRKPTVKQCQNLKPSLNEGDAFEQDPPSLQAGIEIRNLRKEFGKKVAIVDLSLNLYQGQITVLLGHNGAGKSTTMSILTGMVTPTSGNARINDCDIINDTKGVRRSLGLCPQHNIIFDELTVEENLFFFSKLKCFCKKEIEEEIEKYLAALGLEDKRYEKATTLSGGMKRKLCIAIALCGQSKVVLLDEPTAGVDPSARRAIWDILRLQKQGRTILISTHFMDEADFLGDRIAIMAQGKLLCCGSSFFLKKKYGAGYKLILEKSQNCNIEQVTSLMRKHVPNAEVHSNFGSELIYYLKEYDSFNLVPMLKEIENNSNVLGIFSYGISFSTLEDVFKKVVSTEEMENGAFKNALNVNGDRKSNFGANQQFTKAELWINQLRAMFMKKVLATYRSWCQLLIQILISISLTVAGVISSRGNRDLETPPPLKLDLLSFPSPVTLIENGTHSKYANTYLRILNDQNLPCESVATVTSRILDLTRISPSSANRDYIVGVSFDNFLGRDHITAWFNNNPFHSPAVSLAMVLNAVYKEVLNCHNCSIEFTNHPMEYILETQIFQLMSKDSLGFNLALTLGSAMAFVSSFYILFVIKENSSKFKHLQFVSGVGVMTFWVPAAVWDTLVFTIPMASVEVTLAAFQADGFRNAEELGRLTLLMFSFAWAVLPMVYVASLFFKAPASGFIKLTLFAIFTGVAGFLTIEIMSYEELELRKTAEVLHWIFLTSPYYALVSGIKKIYSVFAHKKMCLICMARNCPPNMKKSLCKSDGNFYNWEDSGIGKNLVFLSITGFLLYLVLLALEFKILSKTLYYIKKQFLNQPIYTADDDDDDDVVKEKQKIRNATDEELFHYKLVLRNVTKYYKNLLAVKSLCLGVEKYECFGLLGVNGAGKTTTFKMMTGDLTMTYGEIFVNGFNLKRQHKRAQNCMGYCPQSNALLDDMTVEETVTMFALLKGVNPKDCKEVAQSLGKEFDFYPLLGERIKVLSGGNKRKLSIAIAVIACPPVIYLDEPSTGMDPVAKRHLWDVLCRIRDSGSCIILTSHSMEECEAICTRIAVMVNGQFKCLGSLQHLKNKFTKGYNLTVKVNRTDDDKNLENFLQIHFSKVELRGKHYGLMYYHIEDESKSLSETFGILEVAKRNDRNVEDFSLGQSNLEEIFLAFISHQE